MLEAKNHDYMRRSPSSGSGNSINSRRNSSPPRRYKKKISRSPTPRRYRKKYYYSSRGRNSHSRSRSPHRRKARYSHSRSRSYSPRRSRSYGGRRSYSRSPKISSKKKYVGNRENPQKSRCLGVFGLSVFTTEEQIRHIFSKYGNVMCVQIVLDAKTGKSRGYGFIYFENCEEAKLAKEQCSGMEIDARRIRVDYSITQRAHTPTPGVYMGKSTKPYKYSSDKYYNYSTSSHYDDKYRSHHR